jgi:protoporphyrinogen oxidase
MRIEDIEKIDGSVVIAIPAFCAKKLHGLPSGVSDLLENISYASVDVTTVFTKTPIKLNGIGILTPQKDGILGILFNSSAFYLKMENGFYSYSIFSKNLQEGEITKMFERIYNVEIVNSYFNSYKNSIPIYNDALEKFINYNQNNNGRVRFFGNYTGQVAIGEIILNAKAFANNVI